MRLHARGDVYEKAQGGTIQKSYSFISSRLSSTAVRDFGSGDITGWKRQRMYTLHRTQHTELHSLEYV